MTLKNVSETPGPVKRLSSLQSGIAPGQVQAGVTAVQADSGTHGPGARVVSAVPREHPTSGCPGLAGGRNLGLPAAGSPPGIDPAHLQQPAKQRPADAAVQSRQGSHGDAKGCQGQRKAPRPPLSTSDPRRRGGNRPDPLLQ